MTHIANINNKPEATINEWQLAGNSLIGTVTDHERQNEFHTDTQRTSSIVRMSLLDNWAETRNTFYTLGTRYNF